VNKEDIAVGIVDTTELCDCFFADLQKVWRPMVDYILALRKALMMSRR